MFVAASLAARIDRVEAGLGTALVRAVLVTRTRIVLENLGSSTTAQ